MQTDLFKSKDSAADPFIKSLDEADQPSEAVQEQPKSAEEEDDDFFSFFSSHEKIIMKPESSFKNLRSFLVSLPIDYYILL